MTFFERVNEELEFQEKTKSDLARFLGVAPTTVQSWQSRGNYPPVDVALKIANFLNTSVEYLVTGENPTHRKQSESPALEIYDNSNKKINKFPINEDVYRFYDAYLKLDERDKQTLEAVMNSLLSRYSESEIKLS